MEFLLKITEKLWLRKRSIPIVIILLGAVFLLLATMFDQWTWIDVPTWFYNLVAAVLFGTGVAYSVLCFACDHLPRAPKGTLGVLFCVNAESASLYETAKFKLVERFNEANPGGRVCVKAECVSKKQVKRYDLQNKDSAVKLLKKTHCVLLVRVRYSADDANNNAEDFELEIGCGVRHPHFDEKTGEVLVRDMSMLTQTVRNQHFSKQNAISIFKFTTKTLVFACNYILGFIYLLARDGETAYTLLTSARSSIFQDDVALEEQGKWQTLVDDRIYSTLAQISCDCLAIFIANKDILALRRMEQALELSNTIYPDLYFYNINMAYVQVTLYHDENRAKALIDKCKLSARVNPEKGWLFSDAFLAAYLDYDTATIVTRYNKAIAGDKQSNLLEIVEHIEFMLSEQPEKKKLHLAAALVYEEIADFKLMKQHLSIFLGSADTLDRKSRRLIEEKIANKDCLEECNHNCERCAS